MRLQKLAVFSLLVGLVALAISIPVVRPYLQQMQANVALLEQLRQEHESTTPPPSADELEAQQRQQLIQKVERAVAESKHTNQALQKLIDDINAQLAAKPAPEPTPAAVIGYAPSNRLSGKAYTNADLEPDTRPARVVMDFTPERANDIEWKAAVKSGRCAAYSFVKDDGTRTNRLNCPQVVAR